MTPTLITGFRIQGFRNSLALTNAIGELAAGRKLRAVKAYLYHPQFTAEGVNFYVAETGEYLGSAGGGGVSVDIVERLLIPPARQVAA